MVEVAKTIIMASATHQGLQENYFSIRYFFFQNQVNQMYSSSYRVKFYLKCDPDE